MEDQDVETQNEFKDLCQARQNRKGLLKRVTTCATALLCFILLTLWTHPIDQVEINRYYTFGCNTAYDHSDPHKWNVSYVSVPGFFVQDDKSTDPDKVGPTPDRFGLLYKKDHYWKKFHKKIRMLNRKGGEHTAYKVLWMGRHGEGYHNVGQSYYGDEAWDAKWARKNGNGTIIWGPDAKLTNIGISQAERVHSLWLQELSHGGHIARPTSLFVSPLSRAMSTLEISYAGIVSNATKLEPLIIEYLRDTYGLRTADKRMNKTWIHSAYPSFRFEEGFTEEDELWVPDVREEEGHREKRTARALDRILRVEDMYLSIVAHDKILKDTLKLSKHREYDVPTGGVVPLVLKVTYTPV